MPFDWHSVKASVRRTVHDTFAVQAFFKANALSTPVEIRARLHDKIVVMGDPQNEGYATTIEGVHRIVLFPGDSDPPLVPVRGSTVNFPGIAKTFVLDTESDTQDSLTQVWNVTET